MLSTISFLPITSISDFDSTWLSENPSDSDLFSSNLVLSPSIKARLCLNQPKPSKILMFFLIHPRRLFRPWTTIFSPRTTSDWTDSISFQPIQNPSSTFLLTSPNVRRLTPFLRLANFEERTLEAAPFRLATQLIPILYLKNSENGWILKRVDC